MTDAQKIVSALAEALHDNQISEDECLGVLKALRGIPPEQHMDVLKAFLGLEEQEPEEKPKDYLAVKTFASSEFHVGDEVIGKSGTKYFVIDVGELCLNAIDSNLIQRSIDKSPYSVKRTGRNFPAIQAILDELKKA